MKILINAISAKRGGILTYTVNLLRSLAQRGVTPIAAVPPGFPVPEGIQSLSVSASSFGPARRLLWEQTVWRSIVKRVAPDVLFSSANFGLFYAPVPQLLLMREGGLFDPLYLSHVAPSQGIAAAAIRNLRRRMMLLSNLHADRVMTPSNTLRDLLLQWRPDLADKVFVNTYGTLDGTFHPVAERRGWREDGVLRLLFVSVYYPHKAPGDLCRAVRRLNEAGIPTHATITMSLEEIAASRGSELDTAAVRQALDAGQVTLGRIPYDQLPAAYNSHDLFVFPAIAETFGHPMAEAMSSSIPMVVADTAIAREVCGDNALYFRPFNVPDLNRQILALDQDPELRARLAAGGRVQVRNNLRWEAHVDRLLDIFHQMVRR